MKVKRVICSYSTVNDKLIDEINIDNIPVAELRNILNVDNDDLEVYKVYSISKEQLSKLTYFVPELSRVSLKDIELFAECFQV
jgi:uncharacterized protein YutE (UPF0331/DUF86 family)